MKWEANIMKWEANNDETWLAYSSVRFVIMYIKTQRLHMSIDLGDGDPKVFKVFKL